MVKKKHLLRNFRCGDRGDWKFRRNKRGSLPANWRHTRFVLHVTVRNGGAQYDSVVTHSRTAVLAVVWRSGEHGEVLIGLVRQHRFILPAGEQLRRAWDAAIEIRHQPALHLLGEQTWSLPGGFTEPFVTDYGLEAAREAKEEFGWMIDPTSVVEIACPPGGVSLEGQQHPIFSMRAMARAEQELDAREGQVKADWFTIQQVRDMILSGEIRDPLSVTGLFLYMLRQRYM